VSDAIYKLDELAREAGTSTRTVRYYVQRGLLPGPRFRGKDTAYDDEHLLRLRVIRKLQDAYLPLDAIAAELEGKSVVDLERMLAAPARRASRPPPHAPHAPHPPHPPHTPHAPSGAQTWRRLTVAPGLEVSIADDAPAEVQAVAGRLVEILEAMSNVKEGAK
jgi:DNA-binding transcriptional MerR regulator